MIQRSRLVAVALPLLCLGGLTACADDDDTVPPGEGREVVPGEEGPVD